MDYQEYKQYIVATIRDTYPKYIIRTLIKEMINNGILIDDKKTPEGQMHLEDALDVSCIANDEEKLIFALNNKDEAIKYIEKYEFEKSYRYASIFTYDNLYMERIHELNNQGKAKWFSDEQNFYDTMNYTTDVPTVLETKSQVILKFSYIFDSRINDEVINMMKYPALAVFHKDIKILEIRLDSISGTFKLNDKFYKDKISTIKNWIITCLEPTVGSIDLNPVVKYIDGNCSEDVIVYTQALTMSDGGKAVLDINAKEKLTIPILGELKELMKIYNEEFEKSPKIKQLLDDFIKEIIETSDLAWVRLFWTKKYLPDGILVRIVHNYKEELFSLIQYFGNQKDMEMMNYVTRYLIRCKEETDRT